MNYGEAFHSVYFRYRNCIFNIANICTHMVEYIYIYIIISLLHISAHTANPEGESMSPHYNKQIVLSKLQDLSLRMVQYAPKHIGEI